MPEHVHGCLTCRPDMVPDVRPDDPRYHDAGVCGTTLSATLDGVSPGYHQGVYEGEDGWVLLACEGFDVERIHPCPTCTVYGEDEGYRTIETYRTCVEPRFGAVRVTHDCPRRLAERANRLQHALEPLLTPEAYLRVLAGPDAG